MIRVGIDNGANGAIVALNHNYEVVCEELMPVLAAGVTRKGKKSTKRVLDMRSVSKILSGLKDLDRDIFAVLEHAQTFPGEGLSTAFTAGRGYGAMEMALVCSGIAYEIVRPRLWQKTVLAGVEGVDTKVRSILKCQRRLPDLDLTPGKKRKPHDGLADAACMALYAHIITPKPLHRRL